MRNMIKIRNVFAAFTALILMAACEKDDSVDTTFNGLAIMANVSSDSAGLVDFEATAPGATNYNFDFGDGYTATTADGKISHTYTSLGTNTFYVVVTATLGSGQTETRTKSVMVDIKSTLPDLVWADEFNVNGAPNPANWTFEIGRGNNGWGNGELQYYTDRSQNASVANGVLKITAIKENFSGAAYTSARLITKDKFDFKYGRVEARAKLPAGGGTWPAIWMLGADINQIGWPACGEIDMMEHKGNEPNKIHGSLHYPGRSGGNPVTNTINITNATSEFHIYKLEWSETSIKIYVDNSLYLNVPNTQSIPFNKNFYMLTNVAMGGTFGGTVDPAFTSASMEIDYIRVFSK